MSVRKPGFEKGWNHVETRPTIGKNGTFRLREWQEECFDSLKDVKHWIINAPMA